MVGRRFTVIPGGAATEGASDTPSWHVDLLRPGEIGPEAVAAWRALLIRLGSPDPVFGDPDYLQAAARHRAGGSDVLFALAWTGTGAARALRGAVALAVPHPIWGRGRFAPWRPLGTAVAPAVEPRLARDLEAALVERLKALRRAATLDLGPVPPQGAAARQALSGLRRIPARDLIDVGGTGAALRQRIAEPHRIRDAVEEFLALDAAHAAAPILGDPSEAAFVRRVMQLFARRRLAAVDLTRHDGRVTEAALRLGAGPRAVVWRRAHASMGATRHMGRV